MLLSYYVASHTQCIVMHGAWNLLTLTPRALLHRQQMIFSYVSQYSHWFPRTTVYPLTDFSLLPRSSHQSENANCLMVARQTENEKNSENFARTISQDKRQGTEKCQEFHNYLVAEGLRGETLRRRLSRYPWCHDKHYLPDFEQQFDVQRGRWWRIQTRPCYK